MNDYTVCALQTGCSNDKKEKLWQERGNFICAILRHESTLLGADFIGQKERTPAIAIAIMNTGSATGEEKC